MLLDSYGSDLERQFHELVIEMADDIPQLEGQFELPKRYVNDDDRVWAWDFKVTGVPVVIDVHGGFGMKHSHHASIVGATDDMDKEADAQADGYVTMTVTSLHIKQRKEETINRLRALIERARIIQATEKQWLKNLEMKAAPKPNFRSPRSYDTGP